MKPTTRRPSGILLVAAVAVLAAAGCSMPDYQLTFDALVVSDNANPATVQYSLHNTGYKRIKNATVKIQVDMFSNSATGAAWTPAVDLDVGQSVTRNILVVLSSAGPYASETARVTAAGWDTDSNSGPF
ncbi:MAG: hypothetical protein JNG85_02665 [Spirochaetaceae bacterium]|nr:hypothetical protein [Spirochaetaceae bacterium]